jgi:hypothetical protein
MWVESALLQRQKAGRFAGTLLSSKATTFSDDGLTSPTELSRLRGPNFDPKVAYLFAAARLHF